MAKNKSAKKQAERRRNRERKAKEANALVPHFDQTEFTANVRAKRPEHLAEIEKLIAEAADIARNHDPLHLLGTIAATNLIVDPETYSESTHEGREADVEYTLSLITSLEETSPGVFADGKTLERFDKLVTSILMQLTFYYASETTERKQSDDAYSLRYSPIIRRLHQRGDSVMEHHRGLIIGLMAPHDAFLLATIGFNTEGVINAFDEMQRQIQENLHTIEPIFARLRAPLGEFEKFAEAEAPHLVAAGQEQEDDGDHLDDAKIQAEIQDLRDRFNATEIGQRLNADYEAAVTESESINLWGSIFKVTPNPPALTQEFLESFCMEIGDNTEFRDNPRTPFGPLNSSLIHSKPLIKFNNSYYNFCPPMFFRGIVGIVEELIRGADLGYFERYTEARGAFLENKVVDYFSQLLPNATIYTNLYFPCVEKGVYKHPETDCIILYDTNLIIVESKAGVLSPSARRGSIDRIKSDTNELIDAAYKQGMRVKNFVESAPFPIFEDRDRNPVLCIDMSEIKHVYIVNTTLENLGHLAINLKALRGLNRLNRVLKKSASEWRPAPQAA